MPYDIKEKPCKKSDGTSGDWVKSYKPKKGKRKGQTVTSCHSTKADAEASIAAIEMGRRMKESNEKEEKMEMNELKQLIRHLVEEALGMRRPDAAEEASKNGKKSGDPLDPTGDGRRDLADIFYARRRAAAKAAGKKVDHEKLVAAAEKSAKKAQKK